MLKVVVVGAGYAGTIAANRLAKKVKQVEITVVNPRSEFVERVRLHQQIAGSGQAATPLSEMLRAGIKRRVGTAERIGDGVVLLEDRARLDFDYLLVAVGSTVASMAGTVPVGTWEGARYASEELTRLREGGTVTVIGGGLTGIETASELAAARPELNIRLVGESLAPSLSERARARVRKGLGRLGVEIVEDCVSEVVAGVAGSGGVVATRSGARFGSDLTLWATISQIPDLMSRSGMKVNGEGRALVVRIPARGRRSADLRGRRLRRGSGCPALLRGGDPAGRHAADTLARIAKDRKLKPYSMGYVGQAVSLGRRDGVIQAVRRDDTVRRFFVAGRTAAFAKERISRYAKFGSRTAAYTWIGGPRGRDVPLQALACPLMASSWPALSYEAWSATCDTLHAHTQVLGKLAARLAAAASRSFSTRPCA